METYQKLLIATALVFISGCDKISHHNKIKRTNLPAKYEVINSQRHVVNKARLDFYKTREHKELVYSRTVWSIRDSHGEIIACKLPTVESCANALQSSSMSGGDDY